MQITFLIPGQHLRVLLKQLNNLQQQVIKIQCLVLLKAFFVEFVNPAYHLFKIAPAFFKVIRRKHQLAFGLTDGISDRSGRITLGVQLQLGHSLLDKALLVIIIVYYKVSRHT